MDLARSDKTLARTQTFMASLVMPEALQCVDLSSVSPRKVALARRQLWALPKRPPDAKRPFLSMITEMAMLRLGAGCLSPTEYIELKLYRAGYVPKAKREFIGIAAARKIWFRANFRVDLFALANNKIASAIWFAAHGLPILPTIAIYHESVGRSGPRLLQSDSELRAFIRNEGNYPLFGKPIEGSRSLGTASLSSYVRSRDSIETTAGYLISVDDLVSFVRSHAKSGYQFQSRISPHPAIGEVCGDRLATVRLLTILRDGKPEIARACWKIPAGANAADNFWRPGNLLAQLEPDSGRVMRVIRMNGANHEEILYHPDTGKPLLSMSVPNWSEVVRLACDGAKLLDGLPLVGWDIAPTETGAVLVEANVTPDFHLHQLADRRGILDPSFSTFLRNRIRDRRKYLRTGRLEGFWHRLCSAVGAFYSAILI